MTIERKLRQGSAEWFAMVGEKMCQAASEANLPSDLNVSLVERYVDGAELSDGKVQGIRFDVRDGSPSFRFGVGTDERGDVTVEVTAAAARQLNLLRDPDFAIARQRYLGTGELRIEGDPTKLGGWLDGVHDPIVERTV